MTSEHKAPENLGPGLEARCAAHPQAVALGTCHRCGVARLLGNARLTYQGAFRTLCYASGLNCLFFVPLLGILVGIYHFVVASVVIGAMARTSRLVGFAIYGLPTAAVGAALFGSYIWLVWQAMSRVP